MQDTGMSLLIRTDLLLVARQPVVLADRFCTGTVC